MKIDPIPRSLNGALIMGEMGLCINLGSGFAFVAGDCGHRDEIIATPRIAVLNGPKCSFDCFLVFKDCKCSIR